MTFFVGQIVECIDPGPNAALTKGTQYTVTSINLPFLRVDCEPRGSSELERGYYAWRFRPLNTRKTDVFTEVLNPKQTEVVA